MMSNHEMISNFMCEFFEMMHQHIINNVSYVFFLYQKRYETIVKLTNNLSLKEQQYLDSLKDSLFDVIILQFRWFLLKGVRFYICNNCFCDDNEDIKSLASISEMKENEEFMHFEAIYTEKENKFVSKLSFKKAELYNEFKRAEEKYLECFFNECFKLAGHLIYYLEK